ncbi:MAG: hypothetical protein JSR68_00395 [Proteobacteria bacterium]|nr:hypothetical protein [Pseudomonadota bacterium]
MSAFDALTLALEDWFDSRLCDLPDVLRQRVEKDFFPMPWDRLSADQRRSVALQWDYQHDPATAQGQKFWWDFFERMDDLKKQAAEWEAVATPTAADLAAKEARLAELRQELARMEAQQRTARGDYFPERSPPRNKSGKRKAEPAPAVRYIAYPKAMQQLAQRLNASPAELAAWIFMGPEQGGMAAYVNANEMDPPPRFFYGNLIGTTDYIAPLMGCWFKADDVERFEPADRYIVGAALIERWSQRLGLHAQAFVQAKIAESRLLDLHPTFGGTRATFSEHADGPPLESGLFPLAQVLQIEAEDFDAAGSTAGPISAGREPMSHEIEAVDTSISIAPTPTTVRASTVRREARRLETQKRHAAWNKAYRKSKKDNPGKSDVWHAQRIAKQDVGRGTSAETIRKNMKTRK